MILKFNMKNIKILLVIQKIQILSSKNLKYYIGF